MNKLIRRGRLVIGLWIATNMMAAAELQPDTLNAWNQYVQTAQRRMEARLSANQVFLWADEEPRRAQRLQGGQFEIAPAHGSGVQSVPHGLIHDWIGAIFIPSTTLDQVFSVIRDYRRYQDFYAPTVADSQAREPAGEADQFSMRWVSQVLSVRAALDLQCRLQLVRVDGHRFYSTMDTTRVEEIEHYEQPSQRKLAPDQGNGFLWRMDSIARYEERDGGVYLEVEAMALTRDVPGSLRWIVMPVAKKLSRRALLLTLGQTRSAVRSTTETADRTSGNTRLPFTTALSSALLPGKNRSSK